jgi:hypothetical protein
VKKFGVYATTAVGATAVAMAFLGTGIAAADDYGGHCVSAKPAGRVFVVPSAFPEPPSTAPQ